MRRCSACRICVLHTAARSTSNANGRSDDDSAVETVSRADLAPEAASARRAFIPAKERYQRRLISGGEYRTSAAAALPRLTMMPASFYLRDSCYKDRH